MAGGGTTDGDRLSSSPRGGLHAKFGDGWEITRVPDHFVLQPEGLGFRVFKRQWKECLATDTCIPSLKEQMDAGMGAGEQNKYWEWWSYMDPLYRDWSTPETLWRLNEKGESPDYFVRLFEGVRRIAEPLIHRACSAS